MFVILEVATRIIWGHPLYKHSRVMLFEAGENFVNIGKGFKYYPNKSIRSSTYYVNIDDSIVKEYDYVIKTNNLGLVQNKNINIGDTADIFLGDSFTEGQGAVPWFYKFENNYSKFNKVINGGILGTGPLQWELLANHLQDEYSIKYNTVNVILISADVDRRVWNFSDELLKCLHYQKCTNVFSDFYGYNFYDKTQQDIKKDVINLYNQSRIYSQGHKNSFILRFKYFLKKSALLLHSYILIRKTFILQDEGNQRKFNLGLLRDKNLIAIKNLVNKGRIKGRVYLIPSKQEVKTTQRPLANRIISWLKDNNIDVVLCNSLLNSDFHINDGHPNEKGYEKIRECVSN
jgi:hypothetical protein